jgi:hypothetical protein
MYKIYLYRELQRKEPFASSKVRKAIILKLISNSRVLWAEFDCLREVASCSEERTSFSCSMRGCEFLVNYGRLSLSQEGLSQTHGAR